MKQEKIQTGIALEDLDGSARFIASTVICMAIGSAFWTVAYLLIA
ncbi:MAG TPA: hypothetical protein VF637_17955 [Sphingomicrobium sp.]